MSLSFGKAGSKIVIALALSALPARLGAQVATGTITGVVRRSTGAVIPGVTVTAVEQQTGTAVTVDGVNSTRGGLGANGIELSPPVEAMQEFKVEVNSYGAEFGHTNGGVVNAVTRSGSNQFHGNVYEFLRNDKLDAKGWGNDALPPLRRNNFGGTIGGPIRKNRTFFFYNLDYLIQHDGVSTTRNAGLPAWRTGDFSTATRDAGGRAAPVVISDPTTGTGTFATPAGTTPFPQNMIPTSRLDPAPFTYGNASRTLPQVLTPASVNFDSLLAKNFRVKERWRAQFRWEMFNMTNTPAWGNPSDVLGGTSFGVITTAPSRLIMQLGLKLYW